MKKKMNIKSVIIISALCMTAAGCHKESVFGVSDMGQGIPTAKEVEEGGVDLGEMNALLLQKIEELTLYIIDLQKQIDELKRP